MAFRFTYNTAFGAPRHRGGAFAIVLALAAGFAAPLTAQAGDTDRWATLYDAVPRPPATPSNALAVIRAQVANGFVTVVVADPALLTLQRDADALLRPVSTASRAQIEATLRAFEKDPQAQRMARELDALMPKSERDRMPTPAELRAASPDVARLVEDLRAQESGAYKPANAISAYRLELLRKTPRANSFHARVAAMQQRYAQRHADLDRDAKPRLAEGANAPARQRIANDLVAAHQDLAREELIEGAMLFDEARAALRPVLDHMAGLAREAEARGASAAERVQAYALLKNLVESLLAIDRATIEDVGFWTGMRASSRSGTLPYEFSLAPDVDLAPAVAGTAAATVLRYPPGRLPAMTAPGSDGTR